MTRTLAVSIARLLDADSLAPAAAERRRS